MVLFLATIVGLVIWIVMFFLGAKALESFLITLLIVVLAGTWNLVSRYLPTDRADHD
jgi:hypothetical protein